MTKKIICMVLLCSLSNQSMAMGVLHSSKVINDSLVENFNCNNIKSKELWRSIRPDAFDQSFEIPFKNWSFSAGLYDLANCWSLSRAQRYFYYFQRLTSGAESRSITDLRDLLNVVRGSDPYSYDPGRIHEWRLEKYPILQTNFESISNPKSKFWNELNVGFEDQMYSSDVLRRNFRSEIQFYQSRRFHDLFRNIKYIDKDGARSQSENKKTKDLLIQNLNQKKLTLLLLRPFKLSQHIVVAKSYVTLANQDIEFKIYDSNSPQKNNRVVYDSKRKQFRAPEAMNGLPMVKDPNMDLGVFIVDEDERTVFEKYLLKHYTLMCNKRTLLDARLGH